MHSHAILKLNVATESYSCSVLLELCGGVGDMKLFFLHEMCVFLKRFAQLSL